MADESNVTDVTIEILKDIQARVAKLEGVPDRLTRIESDLGLHRKEVAADFAEMRGAFARLDANTALGFRGIQDQFDGHRQYAVETDRSLEERIKKLEALLPPP